MDSLKTYALAITARIDRPGEKEGEKVTHIVVAAYAARCYTDEEARARGLVYALKTNPESDGWHSHDVALADVAGVIAEFNAESEEWSDTIIVPDEPTRY